MTTGSARRQLSWPRLVAIQFGLILRSRRWVELMGGVVALLSAVVLLTSASDWMLLSRSVSPVRMAVDQAFPIWMLLVVAFASGWPTLLWRDEPPGPRRDYWTLPVPRGAHDLARVAAGGLWVLVAAVVVGIARVLSLPTSSRVPLLVYSGFVLGLITTYCVASISAVVTARPTRWFYGVLTGYALLLLLVPDRQVKVLAAPLSAFITATGAGALSEASVYELSAKADSSLRLTRAWGDSISRAGSRVVDGSTVIVNQVASPTLLPDAVPPFFDRWTTLAATLWTSGAIAALLLASAARHER